MIPLREFFAAYIEWGSVRKTLPPQERRKFERWLARVHPKLVASVAHEPALLRQMCREVRNGGAHPQAKGIGMVTLMRHADKLAQRWLALPQGSRDTFPNFLERVLREQPTKQAFLRFIEGGTSQG